MSSFETSALVAALAIVALVVLLILLFAAPWKLDADVIHEQDEH
jgi:hypothetical protein